MFSLPFVLNSRRPAFAGLPVIQPSVSRGSSFEQNYPRERGQAALGFARGTDGKSIGVCTALLTKFVSRNWAVRAIISMILASVQPAWRTASNSSSETLPAVSIKRFANVIADLRF